MIPPCGRCASRCTVGRECLACGHREGEQPTNPLPLNPKGLGNLGRHWGSPEQIRDELAGAYGRDGNRVKPWFFRRKV